jgi:DNA repair exonuclease SbcCD ATPase subunit
MLALENKSNQKVYWGNLCSAVMICKPFTYDKCDTEEKKIKAIERFLNYGDIKKITEQRKELAEKRILAEMSRNSAKQPGKCPVCKKKLKQGEVACCA